MPPYFTWDTLLFLPFSRILRIAMEPYVQQCAQYNRFAPPCVHHHDAHRLGAHHNSANPPYWKTDHGQTQFL